MADSAAPAIETVRLTKRYGSARGIEELDLRVERGAIFGFLGPNGAGKTTTIRVLLDLLHPTSGAARILGLDCQRDRREVHQRVGYLPGELVLAERTTGRSLIDWYAGLRGGVSAAVVDALVDRFAIDLHRPVADLSKGNRQKLGILQAFMHEPDLLVLDEPTSGLDPLMQEEFMRLVRDTVAEGRTVFLSSHSLDEVQHLAHTVGIIREGRLVAVETVAALRDRAVRRVEIRFAHGAAPGAVAFAGLPGVRDVVVDGDRAALSVSGDLDGVVKAAAAHRVIDFLSRPADLEEIFLTYYRGDTGDPAATATAASSAPSPPGTEVGDGA